MGRIKTTLIKRVARELVERYRHMLTTDFEKNKEILKEILVTHDKTMRNKIAGYVTRLMKRQSS